MKIEAHVRTTVVTNFSGDRQKQENKKEKDEKSYFSNELFFVL